MEDTFFLDTITLVENNSGESLAEALEVSLLGSILLTLGRNSGNPTFAKLNTTFDLSLFVFPGNTFFSKTLFEPVGTFTTSGNTDTFLECSISKTFANSSGTDRSSLVSVFGTNSSIDKLLANRILVVFMLQASGNLGFANLLLNNSGSLDPFGTFGSFLDANTSSEWFDLSASLDNFVACIS